MQGVKKVEEIQRWESVTATRQARQVAVEFDLTLLVDPITQGAEFSGTKCIKGIPKDAQLYLVLVTDFVSITFVFEHESFDEVRVGSPIPIFELEFEEI